MPTSCQAEAGRRIKLRSAAASIARANGSDDYFDAEQNALDRETPSLLSDQVRGGRRRGMSGLPHDGNVDVVGTITDHRPSDRWGHNTHVPPRDSRYVASGDGNVGSSCARSTSRGRSLSLRTYKGSVIPTTSGRTDGEGMPCRKRETEPRSAIHRDWGGRVSIPGAGGIDDRTPRACGHRAIGVVTITPESWGTIATILRRDEHFYRDGRGVTANMVQDDGEVLKFQRDSD